MGDEGGGEIGVAGTLLGLNFPTPSPPPPPPPCGGGGGGGGGGPHVRAALGTTL